MADFPLITIVVLEVVAVVVIARLWLKQRYRNVLARLVWSAILLVPLLGIILYFFITESPDGHPYDTDTTSGSAVTQAEDVSHGD